uniref:Vesicle associated membrane protein 2 n=1 Tax=Chrysemys picta bellii TaxID=8478 RepID=A0A8C3P8F4_CHRPI
MQRGAMGGSEGLWCESEGQCPLRLAGFGAISPLRGHCDHCPLPPRSATAAVPPAAGGEGGGPPPPPPNLTSNRRLQQTQAQVDEVVDIMRVNVDKVLERDQKLSELDDRADALQAGASQFETSAAKLKRKYWWKNLKMMIILGVICAIILIIIIVSTARAQDSARKPPDCRITFP